MQGLIGKKIGMTQIFNKESGLVTPVTIIQTGTNVVCQVKNLESDGYRAVQLGFNVCPEKKLTKPDFVMVAKSPKTLADGLAYRGAITDSVIMKRLWISKNMEFTTIFKLDRMARSVARSKK